jgi:hypothetical protein
MVSVEMIQKCPARDHIWWSFRVAGQANHSAILAEDGLHPFADDARAHFRRPDWAAEKATTENAHLLGNTVCTKCLAPTRYCGHVGIVLRPLIADIHCRVPAV